MSEFHAEIDDDPRNIFYKDAPEIKVNEQLKGQIPFDPLKLAEKGQCALLEISDKLGVIFFAFGPELIVLKNSDLNQVLASGKLDTAKLASAGKNQIDGNPIIFLKVCDQTDTLFLQHQGSEYLLIANLNAVATNAKQALQDAARVQMDLGSVDVRQISVAHPNAPQKLATVVTRSQDEPPNHRMLLINYDSASVVKREDSITTAVFSADGSHIFAGKDSRDENIVVFDLELAVKNEIKLSFPGLDDSIEVDDYRIFWVGEPYKNNIVVFAAYYETQDSVDENLGRTIMFWIGDDLSKPGLTLDALKQSKKVLASWWEFSHQNDDLIPSFSVQWYDNPSSNEVIGMVMQNHESQPHQFKIVNGKLDRSFELMNWNQFIDRPFEPDTEDFMEPTDTLGLCLGFKMLRTKMQGAPERIDRLIVIDEGDENLPYPVTMLLYSLNGIIKQYQLFTTEWRHTSLLREPTAPVAVEAIQQRAAPPEPQEEQKSKPPVPNPPAPAKAVDKPPQVNVPVKPIVPAQAKQPAPSSSQPSQPAANLGGPQSIFKPGGIPGALVKPPSNSQAASQATSSNGEAKKSIFSQPDANSPFKSVDKPFGNIATPKPPITAPTPSFSKPSVSASSASPMLPFGNPAGQNSLFASKPSISEGGWGNIGPQNNALPSNSLQPQPQLQPQPLPKHSSHPNGLPKSSLIISQPSFGQLQPQALEQHPQPLQQMSAPPPAAMPQMLPPVQPPPPPKTHEQLMAELFEKFTPEQKLALTHSNLFTDVFNEQVTAKLNELSAKFPDKNKLFEEMESKKEGFSKLFLESNGDQNEQRSYIKAMIDQTQRFQLTMLGQGQLCDRLKRETRYGIIGDASVSAASPSSKLMKINKTYRDFIQESEYDKEDKEILMEVFDAGNKTLETFDRIEARQSMQEALQGKFSNRMREKLSKQECAQMEQAMDEGTFRSSMPAPELEQKVSWQMPNQRPMRMVEPTATKMTAAQRMKQNLLKNAGIVRTETDQRRIYAQVYINESTKFIGSQMADVEQNFHQIQAKLQANNPSSLRRPTQHNTMISRSKYGELEEDEEDEGGDGFTPGSTPVSESEAKINAEQQQKKEIYRKMIRDRKRQKRFQKQLVAQFTAQPAQTCQLQISKPQQQPAAKPGSNIKIQVNPAPKSDAMIKFQGSSAAISNANKSQEDINNQNKMVAMFCNVDNKVNERMERDQFISFLDKTLITSPNDSPKPTSQLSNFAEKVSLKGDAQNASLSAMMPKPAQSTVVSNGGPKAQQSYTLKSFGSKASDALQTQVSSKMAPQVSFGGEDPKSMASMQKSQPQLDQIAENDSKKKVNVNLNQFGTAAPQKQPLQKQGTMSKLDIQINLKDAPSKAATGSDDIQSQKTMNLADLAADQLKSASQGANLFGSLSIAKKPNLQADSTAQKKETEGKASGLFSTGTSAKNLFGAPKAKPKILVQANSSLNSDKDKPAAGGQSKEDQGDKPTAAKAESKPTGSLFGISSKTDPGAPSSSAPKQPAEKPPQPGIKPIVGSGALGVQPPKPITMSFLGTAQAANTQPSIFGSVDIGAKKPSIEQPSAPFGGSTFGGANAQQKPMSFSSGGSGAAGGIFAQGTNPKPGIFGGGQQAPTPQGFLAQPQPSQQPLSFGNQQPQPMGMMPTQFQGFGGSAGGQGIGGMQAPPQQFQGFGGVQGAGAMQAPPPQQFQGFGGGQSAGGAQATPQSSAMFKPRK